MLNVVLNDPVVIPCEIVPVLEQSANYRSSINLCNIQRVQIEHLQAISYSSPFSHEYWVI